MRGARNGSKEVRTAHKPSGRERESAVFYSSGLPPGMYAGSVPCAGNNSVFQTFKPVSNTEKSNFNTKRIEYIYYNES